MSFLKKLMPSASRAVRSNYWFFLIGAISTPLLEKLLAVQSGKQSLDRPIDWAVLAVVLLGPAATASLQYFKRHNPELEGPL